MREVGNIEAMKEIKEQYMLMIKRVQDGKEFKTEIGVNLHNRFNDKMSLAEFAREVTKTRLNGMQHDIPEIAAAARVTQQKVYGPIGQEVQDLGIRKLPIEREIKLWKSVLDQMVKKGEGTKTFRSKVDGTQTTY